MKKILIVMGIFVAGLIIVMLTKTLFYQSKQLENVPPVQSINVDIDAAVEHLSQSLRFQTISYDDNSGSYKEEFLAFHCYLVENYPFAHKELKKEIIDDYNLFYTWQGTNPELQPILFSGHLDVVPAEQDNWTHPPFDGYVDNEYIWGRGTLDNKGVVISIMEAVEELVKEGYKPERTICFVFTYDEEIGGINGTSAVAEMFEEREMKFEYILDEGGCITDGIVPGVSVPVAMIGTAEKGAVNIELLVDQTGGTSAVPPEQTSIDILCEAINKIEENPFPMKIDGATKQMFEYLGPEMEFPNRFFFSNLWIFDGAVKDQLSKSASMTATLKTTTATTIINGGLKVNIIPTQAKAYINVRIIQGDSIDSVVKYLEQTIDDERVSVKLIGYSCEPSPVSDINAEGFRNINQTIKQVFPEVIVTPYLWTGGTNSKHFVNYADNIYRFSPMFIDKTSKNYIHGADEKISIDNLLKSVTFYKQLIINSDE